MTIEGIRRMLGLDSDSLERDSVRTYRISSLVYTSAKQVDLLKHVEVVEKKNQHLEIGAITM